jgi:hypothetical protein
MSSTTEPIIDESIHARSQRRQRLLLIGGLVLALLITGFFAWRAVHRFVDRPTNEPIREWMNIGYVAHSYHVRPDVLWRALNLPDKGPPDRRPITKIAKELNLSSTEVITRLQAAIAKERPPKPPPEQ